MPTSVDLPGWVVMVWEADLDLYSALMVRMPS